MSLPRYVTRSCDCTAPKGIGYPRPTEPCKCGNRFITEKEKERSVGIGVDPSRPPSRKARGVPEHRNIGVDPSTPMDEIKQINDAIHISTSAPRRPKRRSEPKRDWSLAVAKREEEDDCCRVCGAHGTEAAHILGRVHDQPIAPGSKTLLVLPDRIVPLCPRCHRDHDAHRLDLTPFLTTAEQALAVLDAGSIGLALKRISPTLELAA